MRKASSKAFKTAVTEYYNTVIATPEEQEELHTAFWHYYSTSRNNRGNFAEAFEHFINACATNFDFETYRQRELLKAWYDQTEEEADHYTDESVSKTFCYHIYREFDRRSNERR